MMREAFTHEVQARGFDAAVAIVRDLAADHALLEGIEIEVREYETYADWLAALPKLNRGRT